MYMQHKKNVRYEIGKFGIDQMTWHGLAQCTIGIVHYMHMTRTKILEEFLHRLLCYHVVLFPSFQIVVYPTPKSHLDSSIHQIYKYLPVVKLNE